MNNIYKKYGIETSFADSTDPDQVISSLRPSTRLVYIETPGNPTIEISDIARIARAAHGNNALLVVDNTFMSRALKAGIFMAYVSPMLKQIPDELKLDPHDRLLPVSYGDVCLNYD